MRQLDGSAGLPVTPDTPHYCTALPARRTGWATFEWVSLLGLMLLMCLLSGWLVFRIQHSRNQRQAVTAVERLGGEVIYIGWGSPEWLALFLGEDVFLDVNTVLFLPDSLIDDDGVAWLRRFPKLHSVNLADTRITDTGLVHLRKLTRLRTLDLSDTRVSDAGLVHVANLSQIEELDLSGTRITNACLDQLAALPRLWSVDLTRTQVTHAGIVERFGPKGPPFFVAF